MKAPKIPLNIENLLLVSWLISEEKSPEGVDIYMGVLLI